MAVSKIVSLLQSDAKLRGCPCGAKATDNHGAPTMSVVMQVASIGLRHRLRAKAITIHVCDRCARLILTKRGRALRQALAVALQAQAVDIARQVKVSDAA